MWQPAMQQHSYATRLQQLNTQVFLQQGTFQEEVRKQNSTQCSVGCLHNTSLIITLLLTDCVAARIAAAQ
jgi:hypothetical protein